MAHPAPPTTFTRRWNTMAQNKSLADLHSRIEAWAAREGIPFGAEAEEVVPAPVAAAPEPKPAAPTGDYAGMSVEQMKAESRRLAASSPALVAKQRANAFAALQHAVETQFDFDE